MQELKLKAKFDPVRCRQYLNDELTVFHCHHYSSLFSQLADDAKELKGPEHLRNAAAESMLPVLNKYCETNGITAPTDKIDIAQQYFANVGLGKLKIDMMKNSAEMKYSHVDSGWIKKWGKRDKPVNYIGQGFIAAAFSLAQGGKPSDYSVIETQSIVSGAETSKFTISKS